MKQSRPVPKTLLILTPGFPVNEADCTCVPPQQVFVRSLKQTYPQLNIIVLSFEYPFARRRYNWFGIQVIAFGGQNKSRLFRLLNWIRVWRCLKKLNQQHEVIGLLSFWFDECAFIGHLFAKKYQLKHFSWILGQDAKRGNRYFKWIKPKAESLIALSDFIARQVNTNYGVWPQHTITTGIDTTLFKTGGNNRDIDILGAGSLIALKQYDVFIDAVKAISKYQPNVRAMICGTGPEKENLLKLISKHGLENNVVLLYEVPHAYVLTLMQRTKIFLHTSRYEGFGAVLLEALYAGAQVVSFVKPMHKSIKHHHVVNNAEEMNLKLFDILLDSSHTYEPVLVYPIEQVAASVMQLFEPAVLQNSPLQAMPLS